MAELISIQGFVKREKDNKALAGIKVIATQGGTKITQETDEKGKYVFNLASGRWRISTWAPGYQDPDAYLFTFTANTSGVNFELQEGYSISGLVIAKKNSLPASGVIVNAEAKINNLEVKKQTLTDVYGRYHFYALEPGNWSVQGVQGENQTNKGKLTLGPDASNQNLTLSWEMTKKDWRCGIGFFLILILLLGGLIWGYLTAHHVYPSPVEPELETFSDQLAQVLDVVENTVIAQQATLEAETGQDADDTSMQLLRSMVASLKEDWNSISADISSISVGQKGQVLILINRVETAASGDDLQDVGLSITAMQSVFENKQSIYLWSEPPMSYLEVLFWSLAGILISVFISSGFYLRNKRFYAEGIWMHVSHLLTMPILSLVVVFLISMIKFSIQIEDSEIVLNINDPRLLVAISFIIAVRPWDIIAFVRETGSVIFDKIKSYFSGADNDQDKSNDK